MPTTNQPVYGETPRCNDLADEHRRNRIRGPGAVQDWIALARGLERELAAARRLRDRAIDDADRAIEIARSVDAKERQALRNIVEELCRALQEIALLSGSNDIVDIAAIKEIAINASAKPNFDT